MGVPDRSILDLIKIVRSWISFSSSLFWDTWTMSTTTTTTSAAGGGGEACIECRSILHAQDDRRCRSCGRLFCRNCVRRVGTAESGSAPTLCKFCFRAINGGCEADALIRSSCPVSPMYSSGHGVARFIEGQLGFSPRSALSPLRCLYSRSDEVDTEDTEKHFFSPLSEYLQDSSDVESCSISTTQDFYSFKSVESSPFDSPCRSDYSQQEQGESPNRPPQVSLLDQESSGIIRRPAKAIEELRSSNDCTGGLYITQNQTRDVIQPKPLDFENNGPIWFPPPPEDERDDVEDSFLEYDDEDDEIGNSGTMFSASSFNTEAFPVKEKQNDAQKEPLRAAVHGHFRALVSQLLKGEGINCGGEDGGEGWLDIISSLAWQSANFVKPDTSKGGSMDPGNYVKVKCVSSGKPSDSTFVKGIVCTKNVKHKRMLSQHKNPRLLILGGALEFQRVSNKLASINTVLAQEIEHLKMAVAKVEAHRPNVLLVEKSVSSYAQEYLLEKEISLVLNVKRPLLERIAKCTGAHIAQSIESIASARLGQCEIFRLEKVSESFYGDPLKKSKKTLMYFEGCPRRLGCTILLRGTCLEDLKKVKHVIQYASFAAYHLSLETSFLVDEGASLPKIQLKTPHSTFERPVIFDYAPLIVAGSEFCNLPPAKVDDGQENGEHDRPEMTCFPSPCAFDSQNWKEGETINCKLEGRESPSGYVGSAELSSLCPMIHAQDSVSRETLIFDVENNAKNKVKENILEEEGIPGYYRQPGVVHEEENKSIYDRNAISGECFSNVDNQQSILVSLSSRCVLKGIVCQRAQLLRIKFYGNFDKPLGRYLRDELFDQTWCCHSCQEPAEAHVRCYTHRHGSLTINVRRLPSLKLPGERNGRIWMWHRCLKCTYEDGVPPATQRVVMSDAAWGLSFGKFLELSFSNNATANRIASCGHSLQRDCLRFYGFGSMVAFFRYSPTDILSVHLPPSSLEFSSHTQQEWVMKESVEISGKMESLYAEVFDALHSLEQKNATSGYESSKAIDFHNNIMDLKELLKNERNKYEDLLRPNALDYWEPAQLTIDVFEVNRLRLSLLIDSHIWNRRLYLVDSSLKSKTVMSKLDLFLPEISANTMLENLDGSFGNEPGYTLDKSSEFPLSSCGHPKMKQHEELDISILESNTTERTKMGLYTEPVEGYVSPGDFHAVLTNHHKSEGHIDCEIPVENIEGLSSPASNLSEKIDSAWTGMAPLWKTEFVHECLTSGQDTSSAARHRKIMSPTRVYSFDSALRHQDSNQRLLSSASLHLSSVKSFHFHRESGTSYRDPISKMQRAYSETSSKETHNLNLLFEYTPSFISSTSRISREGVRLLLPQGHKSLVIAVYDNEPSSVICYALCSKEHVDFVACKVDMHQCWKENEGNKEKFSRSPSPLPVQQPKGLLELDDIQYGGYGSGEVSSSKGSLFSEPKETHFRVAFDDDSSFNADIAKFSVTCYFAKQFDALRKKCCPNEIDFIRSLSRCRKWSAQGGKSNVYFAKSLDERFIIKQVTKTELDSFGEFATEYFNYLTESISSGSPTCLAKILGIYQVTVKHLKGGREVKMDLMVMENLFYKKSISRVYDLKGSARSRYNSDTTGNNNVMLDMNLLETLRTKPIFLGTKAKRNLERAVWNDTSFLASVDVMDYSLLVGVDEERKELILGIIDFMRQYTWDKHLETWVKASGILGGPKASPTIISPKQYKKRFRKAMSTYFLAVPDQWPS